MSNTMAQTNAEYQATFKAKQAKKGLKQVQVWVHEKDKQAVRLFAQQLRDNRGESEPGISQQ